MSAWKTHFVPVRSSLKVKVNNFTQRTITGTLFVIVMVGSIVLHPFAFGALFLLVTILALIEFYRLSWTDNHKQGMFTGLTGGILLYGLVFFVANGILPPRTLIVLWMIIPLVVITELFSAKSRPFTHIAFTLLGVAYVALPLSVLNAFYFYGLNQPEPSYAFLLGYFIILWLYDSGAYLVGKFTGKHLLFQRISPKKTWEGIAGGLTVGILAAWGISRFFTQLSLAEWIFLSVLIIVFSTFGDLVESMLKRSVDVKDSGTLLPGHGGILDRFDGVLLSAPVVYMYLYLVLN